MTEERSEQATDAAAVPPTTEDEALAWLATNRWCEEVIGEARASGLARRRRLPSNGRVVGGLVPTRPANVVAFQAIDLLLQAAQGAAGVARRLAGEVLGVAATGGPAAPRPEPDHAQHPRPDPAVRHALMAATGGAESTETFSPTPSAARIRAGERIAVCSFVVENATNHNLHTVAFKLSFLTSGSGKSIPPAAATFDPARFELPPYGSQRVTVRIRTADADPERYVGLAEAGRFRQVVTVDIT